MLSSSASHALHLALVCCLVSFRVISGFPTSVYDPIRCIWLVTIAFTTSLTDSYRLLLLLVCFFLFSLFLTHPLFSLLLFVCHLHFSLAG
jgi:hypothetical protein